jgi:AmiR/NasT family two-component response regulator
MLTADSDQATVAEAGEGEVDAYILKPVTSKLITGNLRAYRSGSFTTINRHLTVKRELK